MSQQTINIGSAPNDGTGDPLRTAFTKCNSNFTELYTAVSPAATVTSFNTRVGAITLSSLDVTNALTFTPLNKAGDTASGLITFTAGFVSNNLSTVTKNTGSLSVIPAAPIGSVVRAINVDGTVTRFNADSFVNAGNPTSGMTMRGARGTGAVPTAVIQGDVFGSISVHGYGATSFQTNATGSIQFVAEGTSLAAFTDSSQPTAISFQVTPVSSISKTEQMRLTSAGVLTLAATVASTNPTTGTIVSSGGMGILGAINQGGSLALHTVNANAVAVGTLPASDTGTLLRLDNVDGTSSVALINSYATTSPNSKVTLRAARGTGASPTAIQSTDVIGGIGGEGYGTAFLGQATGQVNFVSEGAFSGTSQPTAISFQVTATSSVAPSEQMRLTSAGNLTVSGSATAATIKSTGTVAAKAPVTITAASYSQLASDFSLIANFATAVTLTLINPATVPGQILYVKSIGSGGASSTVVSASSNVVPLTTATAGTAILSASGKFVMLQSDGTNWIVMVSN